jgi:hypothetical protein
VTELKIGEKKSMKNPNIKKNPKSQQNKDKSSNATRKNQKGVKLKIKIAKLKTDRQCEKYAKTSENNKSKSKSCRQNSAKEIQTTGYLP